MKTEYLSVSSTDGFEEFGECQGTYKLAPSKHNGVPHFVQEGADNYIYRSDNDTWYISRILGSHRIAFHGVNSSSPTTSLTWYKYSREDSKWVKFNGLKVEAVSAPFPEYVTVFSVNEFPEFGECEGTYKRASGKHNEVPYYGQIGANNFIYRADNNKWHMSRELGSNSTAFYGHKSMCPTHVTTWYRYSREASKWVEFSGFQIEPVPDSDPETDSETDS